MTTDERGTDAPVKSVEATDGNSFTTLMGSASKIVFILVALAVVAALFTGHITGEQFMVLAGMTFTFYFANKGEANKPFAGK
jgi:uncharacterized membrane protein